MIAILIYSVLFILSLICTFSTTKKKFLAIWSPDRGPNPKLDAAAKVSKSVVISQDQSQLDSEISSKSDSLKSVFATFDKNRDGYITKQELRESLRNIGISVGEKDVSDMVEKVDSNGDGLIDFDEFCELFKLISSDGKIEDAGEGDRDGELREAFEVFDGNKDGLITVEELGLVLSSLGFGNKIEDCKEMIRKVDVDGDGMVNFDEFKTMMRGGNLGRPVAVS